MENVDTNENQNVDHGSAAFLKEYVGRDLSAGVITATMAIPLSIGIALMSDYPIQVGLATVAFASFIAFIFAMFRPGNYIGAPGIAAGLAPILAIGVATFGMENMAFIIFMTAFFQALIWTFNWQRYLLMAVPGYLVEGLLAGIGLKIALKFLPFYRIGHGKSKNIQGTGIGLSTVKKIIDLHDGHIFVNSTINKFTEISFTLPVVKEGDE